MATLRIKIGASVDASVATAFTQIEKAAQRARQAVEKAMAEASTRAAREAAAAATAGETPFRRTGKAAGEAGQAIVRGARQTQRALGELADGSAQKFRVLTDSLKKLPVDLQAVAREASRALQQIEREQARQALGLSKPARPSRFWFAAGGNLAIKKPHLETLDMDPVRGAARFGMGAASFLRRSAMGFASGIGVETDFGRMFSANVADEKLAQEIANSGYMPGDKGPNGQLVDRGALLAETRQVGTDAGMERGEVLAGLQAFVTKTGDLQMGREILADMAKLSRATGSNMADMVNAAAEVSNNLGDAPNKAQLLNTIMRQVSGQGKLGAVEIRDMAAQMAKLATTANAFEGGAEQNIGILGVLAQEAKLRGGATNATQAATSVARFKDQLVSPKALKHWRAYGLNPYTDSSHTTLRGPEEIIEDALRVTKGDKVKLNELFPNVMAMRAVTGFANVYSGATHGKSGEEAVAAGIAAVREEVERLKSAQLTQDEVDRAFKASMTTTEAKVAQFNNQMQAVAEQLAGAVLPAFQALAPSVVSLAQSFTDFVGKVTGKTAVDDAQEAQKLQSEHYKNEHLLLSSTTHEMGENGIRTVYSGEMVKVLEKEQAEREPVLARYEAKVRKEAADFDSRPIEQWTSDTWQMVKNAKGGGGLRGAAASQLLADYGTFERMREDSEQSKITLQNIHNLLAEGLARMTGTPPPVNTSGTMPPNSPVPGFHQ